MVFCLLNNIYISVSIFQASDQPFSINAEAMDKRIEARIDGELLYLNGATFLSSATMNKTVTLSCVHILLDYRSNHLKRKGSWINWKTFFFFFFFQVVEWNSYLHWRKCKIHSWTWGGLPPLRSQATGWKGNCCTEKHDRSICFTQ